MKNDTNKRPKTALQSKTANECKKVKQKHGILSIYRGRGGEEEQQSSNVKKKFQ